MSNPFPSSTSTPGHGTLKIHLLPQNVSALAHMTFQYPLKLISPSPAEYQKSILVFLLTYGGGLVGGDQVNLVIDVASNASLSIVTQGHTKIFKSPTQHVVTRQTLRTTLRPGSKLCLLPDPVQPFAESVYEQTQIFHVADDATICVLDWVSQGRIARGENWDFWAWRGRNEIWASLPDNVDAKARLLVRDNVILHGDATGIIGEMDLRKRMQGLGLFGTLILKGPGVERLASFFMDEFAILPRIGLRDFRSDEDKKEDDQLVLTEEELWRNARLKQENSDNVLWSAAKIRGCTIVKFGAHTVEGGRHWIGDMLKREGSIEMLFGDDTTMCVRK